MATSFDADRSGEKERQACYRLSDLLSKWIPSTANVFTQRGSKRVTVAWTRSSRSIEFQLSTSSSNADHGLFSFCQSSSGIIVNAQLVCIRSGWMIQGDSCHPNDGTTDEVQTLCWLIVVRDTQNESFKGIRHIPWKKRIDPPVAMTFIKEHPEETFSFRGRRFRAGASELWNGRNMSATVGSDARRGWGISDDAWSICHRLIRVSLYFSDRVVSSSSVWSRSKVKSSETYAWMCFNLVRTYHSVDCWETIVSYQSKPSPCLEIAILPEGRCMSDPRLVSLQWVEGSEKNRLRDQSWSVNWMWG